MQAELTSPNTPPRMKHTDRALMRAAEPGSDSGNSHQAPSSVSALAAVDTASRFPKYPLMRCSGTRSRSHAPMAHPPMYVPQKYQNCTITNAIAATDLSSIIAMNGGVNQA